MRQGALCPTPPPPKKKTRKIRAKAIKKFEQKQWEIRGKVMGKSNNFAQNNYMPPLSEFSHCFCLKFPFLLPDFAIAFGRICHCFWSEFAIAFPEIRVKAMEKFGQNFERPCIFCPKYNIYLNILYFRFGWKRYEKIWVCYC